MIHVVLKDGRMSPADIDRIAAEVTENVREGLARQRFQPGDVRFAVQYEVLLAWPWPWRPVDFAELAAAEPDKATIVHLGGG